MQANAKLITCSPAWREDDIDSVTCAPDGKPCLSGLKSYEKWYQGGFFGANATFPPTVPANSTVGLVLKASAQDNMAGNLILSQLVGGQWTSPRLAVRLRSQWLDRSFSNVAVPVEMLFGQPNWPSLLMGKLFVKAGTSLEATATDLSGTDNVCRLMARGFRNLIGPGTANQATAQEKAYWQKFRRFLPFFLMQDLGPQQPQTGQTALANTSSQQHSFTCPSDGDFYATAVYMQAWNSATGAALTLDNFTVTSWTEGGPSSSFVDPNILPLRCDHLFSGAWGVTSFGPDNTTRPGQFPGGWGGDLNTGDGQWVHRIHRGTAVYITIKNNSGVSVRISIGFPGYLATCDAAPGEFLAFPMAKGQVSRDMKPLMPGDDACDPCTPGQATRVIRAGQYENGPPCPPQRFAPSRQQLYRGGQVD